MTATDPIPQESATSPATSEPMSTEQAVDQLRVMVCGLATGLLVLIVTFTAFVWKQNRNLRAATNQRLHQAAQMRQLQMQWGPLLTELARYSHDKPEIAAIFARHGVEIIQPSPPQPVPLPPQR